MVVTAYPVAGKRKSFDLCLAFVRGCGGQIGATLRDGAAVFYGVDDSNVAIWRAVRKRGDDWYYLDNAYFDGARQQYFRVSRNRLQHTGIGVSDGARFSALGIEVKPWRRSGAHVVVCPQSASFMRTIAEQSSDWGAQTIARLRHSHREIRMRPWLRDKGVSAASLPDDLRGAHALVTWSSAAAVSAIVAGVPVIVDGNDCAARVMSGIDLEALPTPGRENWLGVLADNQFTTTEFEQGMAWEKLNR